MAGLRRIQGASCAAAMLLAGIARGAEPPAGGTDLESTPRFRLAYAAPDGCPDRDAFVRSIRERTSRPRLVGDEETGSATVMRVVIEQKPEGASGRLDLRDPDGTEETRSVASRTCGEVADALALVAAVMLDPDARMTGGAAATKPPPEAEPAEKPPTRPPPITPKLVPPPRPAAAPLVPKTRWLFGVGAQIGILGGVGPAVAPTGGVFGDVERRASRGLVSTLRVSLDAAATASDLRTGTQTYEWVAATVRLCPAHLSLPARLRLAPCAGFQAGGHRGTTRDVRSPTSNTELWLAPVASGTVEWALSRAVSLDLHGGIVFPLRRSRYFLAPASTIYEVPALAGTMGVGVRVRFL